MKKRSPIAKAVTRLRQKIIPPKKGNRAPIKRQKKSKTALEDIHLGRVAALGCWICGLRACCHHIRAGVGMGRKASHFETIPLCPDHHQNGGYGVAFHAGPKIWQETFGYEREILKQVMDKLEQLYGRYWDEAALC